MFYLTEVKFRNINSLKKKKNPKIAWDSRQWILVLYLNIDIWRHNILFC